jgi:FAD/FMN-containing dehydrogenase
MFPPAEEGYRPVAIARTGFAGGIDRRAAEAIVERIERSTAATAVTQLRVLGGAMARVPADATAFAHRAKRIMVNVVAIYQDPDERPAHAAWVNDLCGVLTDGDADAYAGFLGDEGEERVRAAYPAATWERLAEVKAAYDPDNVFRLNQNIRPAAA